MICQLRSTLFNTQELYGTILYFHRHGQNDSPFTSSSTQQRNYLSHTSQTHPPSNSRPSRQSQCQAKSVHLSPFTQAKAQFPGPTRIMDGASFNFHVGATHAQQQQQHTPRLGTVMGGERDVGNGNKSLPGTLVTLPLRS